MRTRTRYRTHTCGELRAADAGRPATLCGFYVKGKSEEGFDLRDRHGTTRVALSPRTPPAVREQMKKLTAEDVVMVTGDVTMRVDPDPSVATGDVHLAPRTLVLISKSEPLPPGVGPGHDDADLTTRIKYRYLDLRRPIMQKRLQFRSRLTLEVRNYLAQQDFVEIETPYLAKWTPEAAAAFFVPARAGTSFALPQSPQLYKQLLMAGGVDRYFQITRCFRKEPRLGPDRQLEFTSLDLEMAYVDEDDVLNLVDGLMAHIWNKFVGRRLETPVRRLPYADALAKYGTDRPDLRFGLELEDLTEVAARWPVPPLKEATSPPEGTPEGEVRGIGTVRSLRVPGVGKGLDALLPGLGAEVQQVAAGAALFWFKVEEGPKLTGPIAKLFDLQLARDLAAATGARSGDVVILAAAPDRASASAAAGEARLRVGKELNLFDKDRHELLWVHQFPFWEYDPRAQGWTGCRHPFTQPLDEDVIKLERDKYAARTKGFDLVLDGVELGAGSIRNHDPLIQDRIFEMFEYKKDEVYRRWGFVLDAFKFGIPPHGGLSISVDRMVAQLLGAEAIDDVIAFPKDYDGSDPMTEAPTAIDPGFVRTMLGS